MIRVAIGLPGTRMALMYDADPEMRDYVAIAGALEKAQKEFKENGTANAMKMAEGAKPDAWIVAHPADVKAAIDPVAAVTEPSFSKELEHLINRHSMENNSDTPDFILARFMRSCQRAFDRAVKERDNWYRKESDPRHGSEPPTL